MAINIEMVECPCGGKAISFQEDDGEYDVVCGRCETIRSETVKQRQENIKKRNSMEREARLCDIVHTVAGQLFALRMSKYRYTNKPERIGMAHDCLESARDFAAVLDEVMKKGDFNSGFMDKTVTDDCFWKEIDEKKEATYELGKSRRGRS